MCEPVGGQVAHMLVTVESQDMQSGAGGPLVLGDPGTHVCVGMCGVSGDDADRHVRVCQHGNDQLNVAWRLVAGRDGGKGFR